MAQQVALSKAAMSVLGESGVIGHIAVEPQPAKME
jgi:hypothetical protein